MLFTDFDVSEKGRPAVALDNSAAGIVTTLSSIGSLASSLDFGFEADDDEPPPRKRPAPEAATPASPRPAMPPASPRPQAEGDSPAHSGPDDTSGPPRGREPPPLYDGKEPGVYVPPELDPGAAVTTWREYAHAFRRRRGPAGPVPPPPPVRDRATVERGVSPLAGGGAAAEAFQQLSRHSAAYGGIDAAPDTSATPGAGAAALEPAAGDFDVLSLLNLPGEFMEPAAGQPPRRPRDNGHFSGPGVADAEAHYILPTDWYDQAGELSRDDPMAALLDLAELFPEHPPEAAAEAEAGPTAARPPGRKPELTRSIDLFTDIDLEAIWRERHAAGNVPHQPPAGGVEPAVPAPAPPAVARGGAGGDTRSLDTRFLDLFGDVDLDSLWERKIRDHEERGGEAGRGGDLGDAAATMILPAGFDKDLTTILPAEKLTGRIGDRRDLSGKDLRADGDADLLADLAEAERREIDAFKEIAREIDAAEAVALSEGGESEGGDELLTLEDGDLEDLLRPPGVKDGYGGEAGRSEPGGGGAGKKGGRGGKTRTPLEPDAEVAEEDSTDVSDEDNSPATSAGERMRARMERLRREYEEDGKPGGGKKRPARPEAGAGGDADGDYDPFEDAMPGSVGRRGGSPTGRRGRSPAGDDADSYQDDAANFAEGGGDYGEFGEEGAGRSGQGVTAEDLLNEGFEDLPDGDVEVQAPVIDDSDIESGRRGPKPGTEEMLAIVDAPEEYDGEGEDESGGGGEADELDAESAARRGGSRQVGEAGSNAKVSGKSGGGAKDSDDIFSGLEDMDFSDDMDDEMRSALVDDEVAELSGGDGDDVGLDMQMEMPELPKTGFRLVLSYTGKFLRQWLPLRYYERFDRMVGWRENWWFYCDLLAAIIASASLAVIISYYVWYRE